MYLNYFRPLGLVIKRSCFQMQIQFNKHWVHIFSNENYFPWVDTNNSENNEQKASQVCRK